jgi:hypothetical protein
MPMKKAKIGIINQKWEENGGEKEGRRMGCGEKEDRR